MIFSKAAINTDILNIRSAGLELEVSEEDDELKNINARIRELECSIGTLGEILLTSQSLSSDAR